MASLCASLLRSSPALLSRCGGGAAGVAASAPTRSAFAAFNQSTFVHSSVRNFASSCTVAAKAANQNQKMGLPRVFFDMVADNVPVGRVIMEVSTEKQGPPFGAEYIFLFGAAAKGPEQFRAYK